MKADHTGPKINSPSSKPLRHHLHNPPPPLPPPQHQHPHPHQHHQPQPQEPHEHALLLLHHHHHHYLQKKEPVARDSRTHSVPRPASELDEKTEKMKRGKLNWATRWSHLCTIASALFLRGDYVSVKYGGPNGMVVASCIPFSPAIISGVFLLLYPLGFHWSAMWFGTLLVGCVGAILHGGANAVGVGFGFNADLSLISHLVGSAIVGMVRVWGSTSGSFGGVLVFFVGASAVMLGLYAYRETSYLLAQKFQHQLHNSRDKCSRKTLLYPFHELLELVMDILFSPPLAGRHRGDQ